MKRIRCHTRFLLVMLALAALSLPAGVKKDPPKTTAALSTADYPVQPVPFTAVKISGGFWKPRQEVNLKTTLPFALEQCERTGRIKNFDQAAEVMKRRAAGEKDFQMKPITEYPFDDSDVYKAIEGAAYALSISRDPKLEALCDSIIARIAAAQEPDGYLYTWRTMHPDSPVHEWINPRRWLNDPDLSHELYDLGHLYEAGTAYFQATGKRSLLDVCLKSAELLWKDFGQGELRIAPGHQVVEMGLAKLYRVTGDERWIKLARFFLDVRGPGGTDYSQQHKKVLDQDEAVGHAVRANYMYAGMADVAALTGDKRYVDAITKIWNNVNGKKLYITGGVGARGGGEAYGDNYELPQRAYNETCAAIALMMWNHRMFLMTGEAKYMDGFERTLFNGFLSGVSLSGDRFFYPNPLVYDGKTKNNHGFAGRAPWFGCACCPPNLMRTLAALSGYFYAVKDDRLFVNLYAQSDALARVKGQEVRLTQATAYPWDGDIRLTVSPKASVTFTLMVRIPGWAQGKPVASDLYRFDDRTTANWMVRVDGKAVPAKLDACGYLGIARAWKTGDTVDIHLPMEPRKVVASPLVKDVKNRVALERGPVVYCFEGVDNDGKALECILPKGFSVTAEARSELLEGVTVLKVPNALVASRADDDSIRTAPVSLTAIPYFSWNNRGLAPMQVFMPASTEGVLLKARPTLTSEAKVSVSFAREGMDTDRINDQLVPQNATDGFAPNFDFWPHYGTAEWIQYDLKQPASVSETSVYWFDDSDQGGACAPPASWRLLYQAVDGSWQPVAAAAPFLCEKGKLIRVPFKTVTTGALRLELQLQKGKAEPGMSSASGQPLPGAMSAGLFEWIVK